MRFSRSGLLALFLAGALVGVLAAQAMRLIGPTSDIALPAQASPAAAYTDYEKAVINAVRSVSPSVVSVRTREIVPGFFEDREQAGLGTGVIMSVNGPDAYILTNNHVVAGAEQIVVTTEDRRQLPATSLGGDPRIDLVDNRPITSADEFANYLRTKNADDMVTVSVYRPDTEQRFTARVLLEESPG